MQALGHPPPFYWDLVDFLKSMCLFQIPAFTLTQENSAKLFKGGLWQQGFETARICGAARMEQSELPQQPCQQVLGGGL